MTLTVTPLYAALLSFLFLALSWRAISYRRGQGISVGDHDDKVMLNTTANSATLV